MLHKIDMWKISSKKSEYYCDMPGERQNSGARKNGSCWITADKYVSVATDTQATVEEL
jgi:hypothetical protein